MFKNKKRTAINIPEKTLKSIFISITYITVYELIVKNVCRCIADRWLLLNHSPSREPSHFHIDGANMVTKIRVLCIFIYYIL